MILLVSREKTGKANVCRQDIGYPGWVEGSDCGKGRNLGGLLRRGVVFQFFVWVLITQSFQFEKIPGAGCLSEQFSDKYCMSGTS